MAHIYAQLQKNQHLSPFRYPGGKASLYPYLATCIKQLKTPYIKYIEPYAGGAGSALLLLKNELVEEVSLNDADICVYSAWYAILNHCEQFIDAIEAVQVNMDTWYEAKTLIQNATSSTNTFELGFATFFLNRTNRSGILRGAGPIGGYKQSGKWKLDARFYKQTMIRRIKELQTLSHRIHLSNMDGVEFLIASSKTVDINSLFAFIDPPYVQAGNRLYLNTMIEENHKELADFLISKRLKNWVLTYDDCALIRHLYSSITSETLELNYTLQKKRKETEFLITTLSN